MAPSFPFPEHVGGALRAPPFPFPVNFGAKIEAPPRHGSRAGPFGNRDTLSDQGVRLERGRLSVHSMQTPKLSTHPEWWKTEFSDRLEVT